MSHRKTKKWAYYYPLLPSEMEQYRYKVNRTEKKVRIFPFDSKEDTYSSKPLLKFNYAQFWPGFAPNTTQKDGTSCLFYIPDEKESYTYLHIGQIVTQFETEEPIESYIGEFGEDSIPEYYAITQTDLIVFESDRVYSFPKSRMDLKSESVYESFWGLLKDQRQELPSVVLFRPKEGKRRFF